MDLSLASDWGSQEMRAVWSEAARRRTWRRIWLAAAEVEATAGLVAPAQIEELRLHVDSIDLARTSELERAAGDPVLAEQRVYAAQCPSAAAVLHGGLVPADITENADVARQKAALALLLGRLRAVLLAMAAHIETTADLPVLGWAHLQPAEPTTLGYRLAISAQDLLEHFEALARLRVHLRGKGLRGATGTGAPLTELLQGTGLSLDALETAVLNALRIEAYAVTPQTYPRVQDFQLLSALAALAASLHKFSSDLQLMQSPAAGGVISWPAPAPAGASPADPPVAGASMVEQICLLARLVASLPTPAWHSAADALLERALDDSASWRSAIPAAFLATEQMLILAESLAQGLRIDAARASERIETSGAFVALDRVLLALVRSGGDRQLLSDRLRQHWRAAEEAVRAGRPNPLLNQLTTDTVLLKYAQPSRLRELLDVRTYLGQAPDRARTLARILRQRLGATDSA